MHRIYLSIFGLLACIGLNGCGTVSTPAAVHMVDGNLLTGTASASVSAGTFTVSSPTNSLRCSGSYDQFDKSYQIKAPVSCSDGRSGVVTLIRTPDLMSGAGTVKMSDGSSGLVGFGQMAASVVVTASDAPSSPIDLYGSSTPAVYSGNCPTPESVDAAGHRCGGRSAASRPGGYDGYSTAPRSSVYSGGPIQVRGYYRKNGTYVRPHSRRR